jgi:hypothetical protein
MPWLCCLTFLMQLASHIPHAIDPWLPPGLRPMDFATAVSLVPQTRRKQRSCGDRIGKGELTVSLIGDTAVWLSAVVSGVDSVLLEEFVQSLPGHAGLVR